MSALIASTLTKERAKNILLWPTNNFPNNAVMTATGCISIFTLSKVFDFYYTGLITLVTLGALQLYQMNNESKERLIDAPKIAGIKTEISTLGGFEKNTPAIMKKYFEFGKKTVAPMFNHFNGDEYSKMEKLANYCNVQMADLATIWKKHPNFDDASSKKRFDVFKGILEGDDIKSKFTDVE
ncbi:MAG: hypothetical protein KR126chlam5_01445 [Candidatus Anoxychlamydiales bacterium]|nr:hypothetical protein [Candidatus Anoxychlamydiales bacterium]